MVDLAVAAPSLTNQEQKQHQHAGAFAEGTVKGDVRGHKSWARIYEQAQYQLEVNYKEAGKVAYGAAEVTAAVEWGAVEHLLVAGRANKSLAAKVKAAGGTVFEVDQRLLPAEHGWLSTFTGLVALLRFEVPEDAAERLLSEKRMAKASASMKQAAKKAKKMAPPPPPPPVQLHSLLTEVMEASGVTTTTTTTAAAAAAEEDEVEDEFEALAAIYPPMAPEAPVGTEFARVGSTRTCVLAAHLAGTASAVCFRVVLSEQYPAVAAEVVMEAHRAIGGEGAAAALAAAAQAFCVAEAGEPVLFALAAHLEDALENAADAAASSAYASAAASAA